jgi:hypothetical protein
MWIRIRLIQMYLHDEDLDPDFTLMCIRIRLYTLIQIRIRIRIKVMRSVTDTAYRLMAPFSHRALHLSVQDPPWFDFEPPWTAP